MSSALVLLLIKLFIFNSFVLASGNDWRLLYKELNEPCVNSRSKLAGICTKYNECAYNNIRELSICSFMGRMSVVCCPSHERVHLSAVINSRRISDLKCDEFRQKYPIHRAFYITGGGPLRKLHDCPHMSQIGRKNRTHSTFYCGASLISENFVITAAHCNYNADNKISNVVMIENQFRIRRFLSHPQYSYTTKYNDIALVEIPNIYRNKPNLDYFVPRPACLSQKENVEVEDLEVFGYGKRSFREMRTDTYVPLAYRQNVSGLLSAELQTMKNDRCSNELRDSIDDDLISSQICAHDPELRGRDTCLGDSGGPLQKKIWEETIYYELVAITSFGTHCGSKLPGVYTRVQLYLDWIEGIVWVQ